MMRATGYIPINGDAVKAFRSDAMLTRHELAIRCGVTEETIARIERGDTRTVRPRTFRALKNKFNVSAEDLRSSPKTKAAVIPIRKQGRK